MVEDKKRILYYFMEGNAFCSYPFTRARITCEGQISMCCFHRTGNIGNLIDKTFDEIWFGEVAESIRQETYEGRLHDLCKCPGCPFLSSELKPQAFVYNEYPTEIEIDLPNTHCNVGGFKPTPERPACIMCERSDPNFVAEVDLLELVLKKIKHVVPNLVHLHIQGIAEPFWHDQIYRVLNDLGFDEFKDKIQVTTTTNGILMKKENRAKWFQVPRSVVVFSIDAATEPTFYKVRGRMDNVFELVVKHLHEYNAERDRHNQRLKIHNNINLMNVHEVRGMVQMAKSAGVDVVEFNPTSGFFTEILVNQYNAQTFRRAHLEIVEEATKIGQKVEFIRPLDLGYVGGTPMQIDWRPNLELNKLVQIDLSNLAGINPRNRAT